MSLTGGLPVAPPLASADEPNGVQLIEPGPPGGAGGGPSLACERFCRCGLDIILPRRSLYNHFEQRDAEIEGTSAHDCARLSL